MGNSTELGHDTATQAHSLTGAAAAVLAVDLDGSLIASDVLWESFLLMLKRSPWTVALVPFWLLKGRAYLKRQIALRADLDPASLPYRENVLEFLRGEKIRGRRLVLATAADALLAGSVAQQLGLFEEVLASNGKTNLKGSAKRTELERRFGTKKFDYLGNSRDDLEVWNGARSAVLVQTSDRLKSSLERVGELGGLLQAPRMRFVYLIRLLRLHHWIKNLLIFVPLLLAHQLLNWGAWQRAACAFFCFGLCASGVYVLNDLFDLPADRRHPQKKARPLAAGIVSIPAALALSLACISLGLGVAGLWLTPVFTALLVAYGALALLYSLSWKKLALIDVFLLASFYSLRLFAGGSVTGIWPSNWLLGFSAFFFFSLAMGKRYSELILTGALEHHRRYDDPPGTFRVRVTGNGLEAFGRGYRPGDREFLSAVGIASAYASVIILALYMSSQEISMLYRRPVFLWLTAPLVLYWLSRIWLLAHRGELVDDPVVFAIKDCTSYVIGLGVLLVMLLALPV